MILKTFKKEAYLTPVILCLFFLPVFFNPFFANSFTQGKEILFSLILFTSVVAAAIIIFLKSRFKIKPLLKSKLLILLLIFNLIILVADALSPTKIVTIYGTFTRGFGLITQLLLLAFTVYCAVYIRGERINLLLKIFFISGLVVAVYALMQKFGLDIFFGNYDKDIFVGRIFSFLGNPGYLGQFMTLELIVAVYLFFNTKTYIKFLYIPAVFLFLITLFLTGTRTAFVGLILCLMLILIKHAKNIFNFARAHLFNKRALIGGILIVVVFAAILSVSQKDRFTLSENSLRSLYSRFEIWSGAVKLIQKSPLHGYGGETFYIYAPEIITQKFLTLEEDISLGIDRVHNELLETVFSYGIFAGIIYLAVFVYLISLYFKSKDKTISLLALLVAVNIIQNQFAFTEITVSVFIAFCMGGLISLELNKEKFKIFKLTKNKILKTVIIALVLMFYGIFVYSHIYRPGVAQITYLNSKKTTDYATVVNGLKETLSYTPYYSELWYELMMIDPSSMERALYNLTDIEGESGNVLAWKGNFYSTSDPQKSSEYFYRALEKNPSYPNWIRAYADMLYKNGDLENALFLYDKYLEFSPDYWTWDSFEGKTPEELKSYRIFFKNVPDFWKTVDRVYEINKTLEEELN